MYDGRKVANLLLSDFDPQKFDITNLKLNKVLYYVHALHLVRFSKPLIKNHFEAWEHGPVVRVVYHEFKAFESSPILKLAEHLNYASGLREVIAFDDFSPTDSRFICDVAAHYMNYSAGQLRQMTHVAGGPWQTIYSMSPDQRGLRDRIPNELIAEYFTQEFGSSALN